MAPLLRVWTRGTRSFSSAARTAGIHGVWIGLWSSIGVVGTALTPLLVQRPVVLLALSPRTIAVVLAATQLDLVPFVLLGLVRLSVADWSYFEVGRRLGVSESGSPLARLANRLTAVSPLRWAVRLSDRLAALVCRSRTAAALVLALRPNGRHLAVAGAYGVSPILAWVSAVTGTVSYLVILHRSVAVIA